MRIANREHLARPWRVHEIVPDFRLEDVWELPVRLTKEDFPRFAERLAAYDPLRSSSAPTRALFAIRAKLGERFGWDDPRHGVGARVSTLRDRLPADLCAGPAGPRFTAAPFTSVFMTEDEWAAEAANHTMHGVLHFGRVGDQATMAVYVKTNGRLGDLYMAAIKPFRYLVVYPALLREMKRLFESEVSPQSGQGATSPR